MVSVLGLIDDVIDINQLISQDNHKSINFEGNINNLLFLSSKEGNISGDIMSNINQHHSGSGDNVGRDKNTTNIYNSQDLTQAAEEIQTLFEQLEKSYPTDTTTGKMALAMDAISASLRMA